MDSIKNYLESFGILSKEEIELLLECGSWKKIKKDQFFIRDGQVSKEVAFIKSGFFRSFYHRAENEITYCFTFAGEFLTAYSSFITGEKTVENICAMADAEIFSIPLKDIRRLERSAPGFTVLSKVLAEQEFVKMEKRVFQLLMENAEQKYLDLLQSHPGYLQLIPLHHLASYLGITQRHLSRIRRSIMI